MEMSREDIDAIGVDLTPPLYPLAFSLYNKHLSSHCSACFSPLSSSANSTSSLYCSSRCSSSHSTLHPLSAADLLLYSDDSSDLRAALYPSKSFSTAMPFWTIGGLMTNREALLLSSEDENDEVLNRIREGVETMAAARRRMRDRGTSGMNCALEEAALCAVLTNTVEVQDKSGCTVGIAVYDTTFSWINHSCSPNACYCFVSFTGDWPSRIAPAAVNGGCPDVLLDDNVGIEEWDRYGPRIGLRTIKAIKKGEEITIAYTDLLQPKVLNSSQVQSFITICWSVWFNRNKVQHGELGLDAQELVNFAGDYLERFTNAQLQFHIPRPPLEPGGLKQVWQLKLILMHKFWFKLGNVDWVWWRETAVE